MLINVSQNTILTIVISILNTNFSLPTAMSRKHYDFYRIFLQGFITALVVNVFYLIKFTNF